jgi:hypothetical protein
MADWVCVNCNATNHDWASTCPSCGTVRGGEPATVPAASASAQSSVPAFAAPSGPAIAAPAPEPVLPSLAGGLLGGLVAAIGATALWYGVVVVTQWHVGLVAIVVGWLVARGVLFGAEGRGSIPLVAASALFTLLALGVSEYLIVYHFITQELQALGVAAGSIELLQPPGLVVEIVVESVSADPLTLAFWAIALFQAVVIPYRAIGQPTG